MVDGIPVLFAVIPVDAFAIANALLRCAVTPRNEMLPRSLRCAGKKFTGNSQRMTEAVLRMKGADLATDPNRRLWRLLGFDSDCRCACLGNNDADSELLRVWYYDLYH